MEGDEIKLDCSRTNKTMQNVGKFICIIASNQLQNYKEPTNQQSQLHMGS